MNITGSFLVIGNIVESIEINPIQETEKVLLGDRKRRNNHGIV